MLGQHEGWAVAEWHDLLQESMAELGATQEGHDDTKETSQTLRPTSTPPVLEPLAEEEPAVVGRGRPGSASE